MKFGKFRFEFPDGVKSIKDSIAENVEEIKDRGIKNYKDVKESLEDNLGNITGKRDKKSNQQKTSPSPAKFCTSCGTAIKAGSKYCTNCGAQIGVLINNQSSDPKRGMTVNKSITKQSAPIMQSMRKSKGSQHKSAFQNNNRKEKGFFAKNKKAKIACIVAAGVCGWILMIAGIAGSDKQETDSNEPAIVLAEEATVSADESLTTERSIPLPEEDDENEIEDATESENSSNTVMASSKTTSSTSSSSTTTSSTSSSSSAVEEKKTADEKVIAIDKVNVREEPNTDSEVLGRLTVGTELYRYEAMGDGWSFVLYDGQDAYVKSEYLATESEYTAIKKAEGEQAKADDEQAAAAAQTAAASTIASTTTAETSNAATSSGTKTNTSSGGGGGNPDIGNYYTEPATGGAYIVNATNHKVHVSSCHKLPAEGNRLYFNSLAEVQAAGYSDYCGICMR